MPLPRRVNFPFDPRQLLKEWVVSCGDEVEVFPAAEVEKAHYRAALSQLGPFRKSKPASGE
jgi:hypothetical protein